jgi:hypothetical protein
MVFLAFRQSEFRNLSLGDVLLDAVGAKLTAIRTRFDTRSGRCPAYRAVGSHNAIFHRGHVCSACNFLQVSDHTGTVVGMDEGQPLLLGPTTAIARDPVNLEEGGCPDAGPIPHVDFETANTADLLSELHTGFNASEGLFRVLPHNLPDRCCSTEAVARLEASHQGVDRCVRTRRVFPEHARGVEDV